MNILVLQETDWLTRGPHIQHHLFERLSLIPSIKITVIDYDIEKSMHSKSLFIRRKEYYNINRTIKNSRVKIIRTAHLQIPYLRRFTSLITNFYEILKIIKKKRPDIIINYSMTTGFIGFIFAKLFHIPFIFHYIDILHQIVTISYVKNIARTVSRVLLKNSDLVLIYTDLHQKYVVREGASKENIKILRNGVSLENTIVDDVKFNFLKKKLSISDQDFVIFFMGYLYNFAGLKEIINYYNQDVEGGVYNLKFLILGDGGIYHELVNYVKDINAKWVILIGRVPYVDITEYIHLADLCLLSFKINSITKEITPIKIIEYMAMKKPVLSNSLPGVILELGEESGVIFEKNQADLIMRIKDLIPLKKELKQRGEKGFNFVKKRYLWSEILKEFKKLMIDLIAKKLKKHNLKEK
ncbi:MAG: glycosyltransferase [Candidatus Thorarchaeota archaeon]